MLIIVAKEILATQWDMSYVDLVLPLNVYR